MCACNIYCSYQMQVNAVTELSGQICQICRDEIEFTVDDEPFVACNECAFPVCRPCYEYERQEGNQACPHCKTKYKRIKGKPSTDFFFLYFVIYKWKKKFWLTKQSQYLGMALCSWRRRHIWPNSLIKSRVLFVCIFHICLLLNEGCFSNNQVVQELRVTKKRMGLMIWKMSLILEAISNMTLITLLRPCSFLTSTISVGVHKWMLQESPRHQSLTRLLWLLISLSWHMIMRLRLINFQVCCSLVLDLFI